MSFNRVAHWALRVGAVAMLVTGGVFAYRKFHRSDEQVELRHYAELLLPPLDSQEGEVYARLALLDARPGPTPEAARTLLVDDVIPRLIRLRKQAVAVDARTAPVQQLSAGYLTRIDKLIDACRATVRAIDEPAAADGRVALIEVRKKFDEARLASAAWRDQLRQICQKHGLSP